MNNISLHWTEDPALLEQFILGRIPGERLSVLNEHLKTCDQCRKAVEREKDFVQSVKAYGRDQLQARLKEKLGRAPSRAIPWPHVLSAAAIVVVIVGLGIYNRWWREADLVRSEEQIGAGVQKQGPAAPAATEVPPAVTQTPPAAGIEDAAGKPSAGAGGQLLGEEAGGERAEKKKQLDMTIKAEKDLDRSLANQQAQGIAGGEKGTGKEGVGEFWVDGILVGMSLPEKSVRLMAREDAAAPEPRRAEIRKETISTQQGRYLLQQQPGTALPMAQQQLKKGIDAVPTKVEHTRDGAILTVYTDQFDLHNKTVQGEFAGIDSLVFVVDGVRIAYKISDLSVKK